MSKFYVQRCERRFREQFEVALQSEPRVLDLGRGNDYGENQLDGYGVEGTDDTEYLTMDIRPETSPTAAGDLANLPFDDESFGIVFCESVLEHVDPVSKLNDCFSEIHRVLADGGILVGWVPFCYHFHGEEFPDGTRFTYDGVERLLTPFAETTIQPCGGPISVFLDSVPRVGYQIRTAGVEAFESKLRHHLFTRVFEQYREDHKKKLNSVGFRFVGRKSRPQ